MFTFNKSQNDHSPWFSKKTFKILNFQKPEIQKSRSGMLFSLKEETSLEVLKEKIKLHTNCTSILQTSVRLFL